MTVDRVRVGGKFPGQCLVKIAASIRELLLKELLRVDTL